MTQTNVDKEIRDSSPENKMQVYEKFASIYNNGKWVWNEQLEET